jgi:hypothetical protein
MEKACLFIADKESLRLSVYIYYILIAIKLLLVKFLISLLLIIENLNIKTSHYLNEISYLNQNFFINFSINLS